MSVLFCPSQPSSTALFTAPPNSGALVFEEVLSMRMCTRRSCTQSYAASIRDCTRLCTSTCFPIYFHQKPEPFILCRVEPADNSICAPKGEFLHCRPLTTRRQSDEKRRSVHTECPRQEPRSFLCTSLFETMPLSMMQPDTVHVSFFPVKAPPKPDDHETIIFALPSCNDE